MVVHGVWLAGFDALCLYTMYAGKPMQSHGLMQAIARVNRVFRDKPGGFVVDYLDFANYIESVVKTVLAQAELLCAEWG